MRATVIEASREAADFRDHFRCSDGERTLVQEREKAQAGERQKRAAK